MELFKIFGSIVVDNKKANRELDQTANKAERTARRMNNAFEKVSRTLVGEVIPAIGATGIAMGMLDGQADRTGNSMLVMAGKSTASSAIMNAGILSTVALLGTALIPIIAVASAHLMALASALMVATGGLGALLMVAVPVGSKIGEVSEEIQKQKDVLNDWSASAEAKATAQTRLNQLYDETNPKILEASENFIKLKATYQELAEKFTEPIADMMSSSMQIFIDLLGKVDPIIQAVIPAIQGMIDSFGQKLNTGQFDAFFEWIANSAPQILSDFGAIFANTFGGIMNLFMAFDESGKGLTGSLVDMTQRFQDWSAGLSESQGFQNFIDYIKTNAPLVKSALKEAMDAVIEFGKAFAPVGEQILIILDEKLPKLTKALEDLGDKLDGVNPDLITFALGFSMVALTLGAVGGVISGIARVFMTLWGVIKIVGGGLALLGGALAGVNPVVLGVIGVIMLLVGVFMLLWSKSDGFKNACKTIWGNIKTIISGAIQAVTSTLQGFADFVSGVVSVIWDVVTGDWKGALDGLKKLASDAVSNITGVFDGLSGVISGVIGGIKDAIAWAGKITGLGGGGKDKGDSKKTSGKGAPMVTQRVGGAQRHANGTDYFEGGWTSVGEQGRELVKLPTGSQIVSNHDLESALKNGGNSGVNQTINIYGVRPNANEVARKFRQSQTRLAQNM